MELVLILGCLATYCRIIPIITSTEINIKVPELMHMCLLAHALDSKIDYFAVRSD